MMKSANDIAWAVSIIPDYTPIAEMAKAACCLSGTYHPYDRRMCGHVEMPGWQAKIFEAQIMVLLGRHL